MQFRTARDIGALIRDQRKKQELGQAELAEKIGVSRRWVMEVERGKPRAEIGLVLKALEALNLNVLIDSQANISPKSGEEIDSIDIDSIIQNAKTKR